MIKVVNGIEKVLGMNDFPVNKLSDRLGLIEFNEYTNPKKKAKDVNGNEFDYYVFAVKCTNHFNNKQITVSVSYETANKVVLDSLVRKQKENTLEKVFIDFEDLLIGHYINGSGDFTQIIQTYRAEKVRVVEKGEVEKIFKQMNDKPLDPVEQVKQMQQEQQKK